MKKFFKDIDFSTWFIVIGLFILYFCTRNTMGLMDNKSTMVLSTVPMDKLVSQINSNESENSTQQCNSLSTQNINDTTEQLTKSINDLQKRIKADQDALNSIQNLTNNLSTSIGESQPNSEKTDQQFSQDIQDSASQIGSSITQLISRVQDDVTELNDIQTTLDSLTDSTKQATDLAVPKRLSDSDKEIIKEKARTIRSTREQNYEQLKTQIENNVYCQTAANYALYSDKNFDQNYSNDDDWYTNFGLPVNVKCKPLSFYGTYPNSVNSGSTDPSVSA